MRQSPDGCPTGILYSAKPPLRDVQNQTVNILHVYDLKVHTYLRTNILGLAVREGLVTAIRIHIY